MLAWNAARRNILSLIAFHNLPQTAKRILTIKRKNSYQPHGASVSCFAEYLFARSRYIPSGLQIKVLNNARHARFRQQHAQLATARLLNSFQYDGTIQPSAT